jgi:hypothetical protein
MKSIVKHYTTSYLIHWHLSCNFFIYLRLFIRWYAIGGKLNNY